MPKAKSSTKKANKAPVRSTRRKNNGKTKSNNKAKSNSGNSNNKYSNAISLGDIRGKFKQMDTNMRIFISKNNLNNPHKVAVEVSRQWQGLFKKPLSFDAAKGLSKTYVKAHGGQNGGMAPLDYVMRPGMPGVATYATFPTEAGADVKAVSHLDVYYNSGIGRSCGTENTTATVPANMGSNQVMPPAKGGARRSRHTRKRGGDFLTAMQTRAFVAENPAGMFQRTSEAWMGQPASVYDNRAPEAHAWATVSGSGGAPLNPAGISIIEKDSTLANPSPYPAVRA